MRTAGVVLLLLAVAIGIATVMRGGSEASVEVRMQKAEQRGVTSRVLAQGKVKAKTQVDVSSEVAGRVAVVNVEIGDVVKIGDVLFALDGEQLRNAVEQIGASLAAAEALLARSDVAVREAERALERDQKLAAKNVLPEDTLKLDESRVAGAKAEKAQAQANVERTRVDLNRSKDALRRAKVQAPQAGTVVAVGVEVGRVVSSSTGLSASPDAALGLGIGGASAPVVIADLSELMVRLDVDELDVTRVRVGQKAIVKAQGIKDAEFDGVVERVGLMGRDVMGAVLFVVDVQVTGTRVERDTRTRVERDTRTRVERDTRPRDNAVKDVKGDEAKDAAVVVVEGTAPILPAPKDLLRPGMSATAEIEVEHIEDTVTVPLSAVLEQKKEEDGSITPDRVFVVDGAGPTLSVRQTAVTLGPSEGDAIAVLSGVAAGERIVLGPFRALKDLKDGDKVEELVEKNDDKDKEKK
jgi:HlyD family secretion protein